MPKYLLLKHYRGGPETQVSVDGVLLDLVASRALPKGVTLQVYRPTGRPQYATATAD